MKLKKIQATLIENDEFFARDNEMARASLDDEKKINNKKKIKKQD